MNKKSILGICILMFLVLGSFSVLAANTHDLYFNNHDGLRVEIQNGHSFGITIEYDGFFAGERKYQFINNGDGTFTEIERAVNPSYSFADIKDIVMYGLEKSAYVTLAVDQPKYDYTSFTLDKKNVHLREKSTGIFQSFPSRDWSRSNEHDVAEKLSYIFGISGSDPLIDLSTQSERTAENKRIIEYLSDKTEEQFQKIAFHFKDFTSKDLETELSAKLTASEYTRARGQLSESDFNALREWLDNNEFQYNYNNPDLNSKLVGLYENKGHFVFFMVVEDAYNKD